MTVTHRTQLQSATQRDAWVEINLSSLERNFKKLKDLIKTEIMAIVKADAYGHGATTIAPILQSLKANSFGVATVDEGISLRKIGINIPIIILGATPSWTYESCYRNKLTITIYSLDQLKQLEDFAKKTTSKVLVQIKIDTGMNRLGINLSEAVQTIQSIIQSDYFQLTGIFTHLADAKNHKFSRAQKERFDNVIKNLKDLKIQQHIANSYAAINYPEFRCNLVRLGISLYGQEFNFLEPIISLKGRITEIHKAYKGESVSYERIWTAQSDSLIATVPIGYADGVDKNLSNKITAIYNGNKINQIGAITMDQMMFDVSNIKGASVGDTITLIGKDSPISHWAQILNTITYELVCRLRMRLPRIYTRE